LRGSRKNPHSSNPSSSTIMEKEKESSRLSWPWKKKSSNKAAAAAVTTSLASAGGVGGASPNLASLFQDNNQQVQTPPFVPPTPPPPLSLCVSVLLLCCLKQVQLWCCGGSLRYPSFANPELEQRQSSSRTCWDRPRSNTSNLHFAWKSILGAW
jgi:hypothetical protein